MTNTQSQKMTRTIPKFRFPEFKEDWKSRKLSEFLTKYSENNKDEEFSIDEILSLSSSYGIVNRKELLKDTYDKVNHLNYKKTRLNDFVYGKSISSNFPFGLFKVNDCKDGLLSTLYFTFKVKENVDSKFLDFYFSHPNRASSFLKKHVLVGDRYITADADYLLTGKINLPEFPEQQKLVSFLSLIDEWIVNLKKQKDTSEEYKKGIMQKIFSQEIRFKDDNGKSFPKWEEKKLGKILKERKEYSTKGKGYPHISLTTQGVVPKSERYNRDFLVGDDEVKGYKITRLNDLCYNPANLKFGVISINKLGAGIFSPIYVTFEIIEQNIDFVGYYLIRDEFINKARRYEQGTVYERMAVSSADFVKVKVAFPSLPEQQKIADFLTSLDKAIEAKQQQITLAENWKKGLMQGLFI